MNITNLTASYTRKINHALYGGGNYESSDHFASLSAEIDDNEDVIAAHKELKNACEDMVNTAVEDEITSFAGGAPADSFYTFIRDMVARRKIDGEFYHQCNKRQQAILQAIKRGLQMKKRDDERVIE